MTNKIIVFIAFFWLWNNPAAKAQTKTYSIEEVWQKTLNFYPTLTSKKELIEEQKIRKDLVRKQFFPEVVVQAQQTYGQSQNIPASFFPLPGVYTSTGSSQNTGDLNASSSIFSSAMLQWNFIQFGRQKTKLIVADEAIKLGIAQLNEEQFKLLSKVTRIYFAAVQSSSALEIAQADSKRLSELYDLTKAQVDAGLQPGADSLLLKSSLLQSQAKQFEQKAILKEKLVQLASFTGENNDDLAVDNSFYNHFTEIAFDDVDISNHPFIQAFNTRMKHAEAGLDLVKKEVYPSIGLIAGAGIKGSGIHPNGSVKGSPAAPWDNASGNYLAGIGATWNFSSLYQNKTKQSIARHNISSLAADKEAAQIELNTQYQSALAAWTEQIQNLKASQSAVKASREAYELYEVRYQSGLINLIELLQLQKILQDTERNYLSAVNIYWKEIINQAESLGNFTFLLQAIKK